MARNGRRGQSLEILFQGARLASIYDMTRFAYRVRFAPNIYKNQGVDFIMDDRSDGADLYRVISPFIDTFRQQYTIEIMAAAWQR